jgi:hypothetical protein
MDNEENTPGIRGISAAVFDHSGRVAGAVGVGGVDFQFRDRMKEIVTAVKDCARAISERLGFSDAGAKTRDLSTHDTDTLLRNSIRRGRLSRRGAMG